MEGKTLTEHWGIEPTPTEEFNSYLQDRIEALQKAHKSYKDAEAKADTEEQQIGYSSCAAGLHDTIKEVEKIKEKYNQIHKQ